MRTIYVIIKNKLNKNYTSLKEGFKHRDTKHAIVTELKNDKVQIDIVSNLHNNRLDKDLHNKHVMNSPNKPCSTIAFSKGDTYVSNTKDLDYSGFVTKPNRDINEHNYNLFLGHNRSHGMKDIETGKRQPFEDDNSDDKSDDDIET